MSDLTDAFKDIADAIRAKTGKTNPMTLKEMAIEIANIQAAGGGFVSPFAESLNTVVQVPIGTTLTETITVIPKTTVDMIGDSVDSSLT